MWIFSRTFYGNSVATWLLTLGLALAIWGLLALVKWVLVNRLTQWSAKTTTDIDDFLLKIVSHTRRVFLVIVAAIAAPMILGAARVLVLPDALTLALHRILIITALIQASFWGSQFIEFALARWMRTRQAAGQSPDTDGSLRTTVSAVRLAAGIVLYSLLFLLILDNLGVDVTALVAGLGVGGIAVALAVQNILGDLFSSFSIVVDKPFVLGDFIIVGNEAGTVEKIGLKTTRIKSISGEQIVFSNSDLLQSRVRNYKRMAERRVLFRFGVLYSTPAEKLEQIPQIVREIIESQERTRFDRAHFQKFGDSSLEFEAVYFVSSPEYVVYAAIENKINLALYRRFAQEQIQFAYPTRSLHIEKLPPVEVRQSVADGR